jgi:beta-lactamase class C
MKYCISTLLLFVMLAARPSVGLSRDRIERTVNEVIRPLMARDRLPGVAVGITLDGHARVFDYGVASLETQRKVTPDTLFEIGSISKTFTATLASYAALTGHISLADSTSKYLPALEGSRFGDISLLNLGTHTPGGVPLQVPPDIRSDAELMLYLRAWRPKYPPGTYRTYSNLGIGLLGFVTARSMHENFRALMEHKLLLPLGLRQTYLDVPAEKLPEYAQGYTDDGEPIRMVSGELAAETYGIRSTAGDMIRFVEMNMGLIRLNRTLQRAIMATHTGYFAAGPLTQDLIWEQFREPVTLKTLLQGNSQVLLFDAVPVRKLDPAESPSADAWINKTGSTNGFGAYVAFIPQEKLGVVILANKSFPISDRVTAAFNILSSLAQQQDAVSKAGLSSKF